MNSRLLSDSENVEIHLRKIGNQTDRLQPTTLNLASLSNLFDIILTFGQPVVVAAFFFLDCTFCVVFSHRDFLLCHIGVEMS